MCEYSLLVQLFVTPVNRPHSPTEYVPGASPENTADSEYRLRWLAAEARFQTPAEPDWIKGPLAPRRAQTSRSKFAAGLALVPQAPEPTTWTRWLPETVTWATGVTKAQTEPVGG